MAYQVQYKNDTWTPEDELIPGNSASETPVKFHLVPAEGPDLARVKSVLFAMTGVAQEIMWTPDVQDSVLRAFETGRDAFARTVSKIDNLTIPAVMAVRFGLLKDLPKKTLPGGEVVDDPHGAYPIQTGWEFSKVSRMPQFFAWSVVLATKIAQLTAEQTVDPRFFLQPSGSSGTATPDKTPSTAGNAANTSGKAGTAASQKATGRKRSQPAGTSPQNPPPSPGPVPVGSE